MPALRVALASSPIRSRFGPISTAFHGPAPGAAGLGAGPEAEAFVVLGGRHDVLGAGAREEVGPLVGVEQLGRELRGEILVVEILAVVSSCGTATRRCPASCSTCCSSTTRRTAPTWPQAGHRVDAPVDEDAELGVEEPLRRRPLVQRLPFRLVTFFLSPRRTRGEHSGQ